MTIEIPKIEDLNIEALSTVEVAELAKDWDAAQALVEAHDRLRKQYRDLEEAEHESKSFTDEPRIKLNLPPSVETVQAQIAKKIADKLEKDRPENQPAPLENIEARPKELNPYIQKWVLAEQLAREPEENWRYKYDFMFESMIKYCYSWIRTNGAVPQPYPIDIVDLYWQRPTMLNMEPTTVERRDSIVLKIRHYLNHQYSKALAKEGTGFDPTSRSYRVTLAARKLESLIEQYAINWKRYKTSRDLTAPVMELEIPDADIEGQIREAAKEYYKAHYPIVTSKVGPKDTLDPDYVGYVELIRKYGLKHGELLHEADIH
jgi:hypothetical protein